MGIAKSVHGLPLALLRCCEGLFGLGPLLTERFHLLLCRLCFSPKRVDAVLMVGKLLVDLVETLLELRPPFVERFAFVAEPLQLLFGVGEG